KTIVDLGRSMGLSVVAEGVETQMQQEMLRDLNCDDLQGYLFSAPIPALNTMTMFARGPVRAPLSDTPSVPALSG
ncbi:MAG: EAL domain-containing protein, partial [Devosiaceae bacterium]